MKKILIITLIFTFFTAVSANGSGGSFELNKANHSVSSLLQNVEGQLYFGGSSSVSCSTCDGTYADCESSGASGCGLAYIRCLRTCTGMIP